VEQVNAKLGKCMATAKGTPVPSEMTPMYSGVKSLYGTKAGLVVKRRFFDSYGRRIAAVGLARYAGPIPQFFVSGQQKMLQHAKCARAFS